MTTKERIIKILQQKEIKHHSKESEIHVFPPIANELMQFLKLIKDDSFDLFGGLGVDDLRTKENITPDSDIWMHLYIRFNQNMNIEKIYEKYDGLCAYCGQRITLNEMKVDKMMPDSMEYVNLMPCCNICKDYKGNDNIEEFREKLKVFHKLVISYNQGIAINYGMFKIHPFVGKFLFERY